MNRSEMRTEVRYIVGESVADFWTDAEVNLYLNEAMRAFHRENRWSWTLTEGTGQLDANDPELLLTEGVADYRHLNFLLTKEGDTRPYRPEKVSPARGMELRQAYYTAQSYPRWWYVVSVEDNDGDGGMQTMVRFIPTPTSIVDLDFLYYRVPPDLDGDSDVPEMPIQYQKALVHYAAGTAWLKELSPQAGQKAQEQFSMYDTIVQQAKDDEESSGDDEILVVGGDVPLRMGNGGLSAHDYALLRISGTLGP